MSLFETIEKDYVQAYKAKDAVRLTVLRLLKTAVKNRLVDLCRPGGTLDDAEMLDLIIKEGKQRQDSIEQYTTAGRQDLADKEAAELAVIQSYLPKPLTEEELTALSMPPSPKWAPPRPARWARSSPPSWPPTRAVWTARPFPPPSRPA